MTPTPDQVRDGFARVDALFLQLEIKLARTRLALSLVDRAEDAAIRRDLTAAMFYTRTLRATFATEATNQVEAAQLMASPLERSH